jgi:copper homeostasis protein CutC
MHQVLTSGSYNKSLHSDADSLKSSVKQGDSSFDIMSNSDKSNSNAPDASGLHMKLMISSSSAAA